MIEQLEQLRDLIEEAVDVPVLISPGRPPAPSSIGVECQTVVYVFGDTMLDLNQANQNECVVRSRWSMAYEIWTCYPEDWADVGEAEHKEAADRLYGLMNDIWCALVTAKDEGDPWDCSFVELNPLIVQQRLGTAVSALGGVTLPYHCTVTSP